MIKRRPMLLHLLVTTNSEYYLFNYECVAVRDRHSGEFVADHLALGCTVRNALTVTPQGAIQPQDRFPRIGERACFDQANLISSAVEAVQVTEISQRPPSLGELGPGGCGFGEEDAAGLSAQSAA